MPRLGDEQEFYGRNGGCRQEWLPRNKSMGRKPAVDSSIEERLAAAVRHVSWCAARAEAWEGCVPHPQVGGLSCR